MGGMGLKLTPVLVPETSRKPSGLSVSTYTAVSSCTHSYFCSPTRRCIYTLAAQLPLPPLIRATHNIAVAVKVTQNPAVLASKQKYL